MVQPDRDLLKQEISFYMEKITFNDYVETRYNAQLQFYSNKSALNQKRYKKYQWILIILSASTPVLAALSGPSLGLTEKIPLAGPSLQVLLIVISAVVAILTTGLKTFDYQQLWITYRSTYEKLKPEIHYYHFSVGPYGVKGVDKETLFVTRVEAILGAEHMQWSPPKLLQDNLNQQTQGTAAVADQGSTEAASPASTDVTAPPEATAAEAETDQATPPVQ